MVGLLGLLILAWLPFLLDPPGITYPELRHIVLGEKVTEGYTLYTEIIDPTPPLAAWFYGACDWVFGRNITGRHITAFVLLFLQSVFLGIMLITKKTFAENTYAPSLLFSLLTLLSFDMLQLSAELVAFGFMLLALYALLTELEFRSSSDETVLNLGLFTGISSLLIFSYALFIPGFMLMLLFFTRNTPRKYLLMVVGFLLPHLLLISCFNLLADVSSLWERFYLPAFHFSVQSFFSLKALLIIGALPLFYWLVAIIMLNRKAHLTKYQAQVMQAMWLWFFAALIQIAFAPELRPQSFLPVLPPLAFFFTHFLLLIRRRKFANMNTWIMLIGITGMMYLVRYEKIEAVPLDELIVKSAPAVVTGKRVLNLSADPSLFLNNKSAPAFTYWPMAEAVFSKPDYYENILLVNHLMRVDPPEIILDPHQLMPGCFDYLPELKKQYRKTTEGNWVKVSN